MEIRVVLFKQRMVRLVHLMRITTEIVIFITMSKMCCNVITKPIH